VCRGSKASRTPSPRKLHARTDAAMKKPGAKIHG